MQTTLKPITNIHGWRLAAIMIGSALTMALTTPAFAANSAPTASTSISPSPVWENDIVTLNATASHSNPLGFPLVYQWQQQVPSSPMLAVSPDNSTLAVMATFVAPTVPLPGLTQAVTFKGEGYRQPGSGRG